jgi:hypothetical protein
MRQLALLFLILNILALPGVQALEILANDTVSIDEPIDDDLFAAGGTVIINAPVDSVVIAGGNINIEAPVGSAVIAGGNIGINAPIQGDLFVTGGQVNVNSDVGGKIVAAGGTLNIRGNVARNLVMAGGQIGIQSTSEIGRDALIAGGNIYNAGKINGTLTVRAEDFQNVGTAGAVDFQKSEPRKEEPVPKGMVTTFGILLLIGSLIVGLVLVRLFPTGVSAVDQDIRESSIVKTLAGFVLIIAFGILIIISAMSIIGLPFALVLLMTFFTILMLANLFVSFSLGKKIGSVVNKDINDILALTVGFVILNILFLIPYAGPVIKLISISLGFGAVICALHRVQRKMVSGAHEGSVSPD